MREWAVHAKSPNFQQIRTVDRSEDVFDGRVVMRMRNTR